MTSHREALTGIKPMRWYNVTFLLHFQVRGHPYGHFAFLRGT